VSEIELLFQRSQESIKAARMMLDAKLPNIAASRAYYAMFYIAEALLLKRGLAFSSHSVVIAAYGKSLRAPRIWIHNFTTT
jgi:uncharacterized protein (UPF0332 family)